MEPVAYDELLDSSNSVTGPGPDGASGTGPRPHAQVHLLSPTDKCKVENLEMINSSFDKASVLLMRNINSHTTTPCWWPSLWIIYIIRIRSRLLFLKFLFYRFARSLLQSMSTTGQWLASVAERSSEGQFRTRRRQPTCAEEAETVRLTWELERTANFAG